MLDPYLTIIIPSYNRREKLVECLERLKAQSLNRESFEVIVVDDGSDDDTQEHVSRMEENWPELTLMHQKNSGQGIARNKAIKKAKGEIVLFIGDDIYAQEDFLKTHVNFHQDHPEQKFACLGLILWDPTKRINLFMEWLTNGGPQFAYHKLEPNKSASSFYFYTSNVSLKRELLEKHKFDTDFKGYGWEDIELGYRLEKEEEMEVIYTPDALAYHDHYMEESSLERRMRDIASNAKRFEDKHPGLKVVPTGIKYIIFRLISFRICLLLLSVLRIIFPTFGSRSYWYAKSMGYLTDSL